MARIRRRARLQRADYTVWHAAQLCSGHDYFGNAWGNDPDPALIAQAWEDLGAGLLQLHISHSPGTRPWAWWLVVAPERRRRVDGKVHPHDDGSTPIPWNTLSYGLPGYLQTEDHFAAIYESQTAYLHRLQLLTPGERRALDEVDAECSHFDDHPSLSLEDIKAWMEATR